MCWELWERPWHTLMAAARATASCSVADVDVDAVDAAEAAHAAVVCQGRRLRAMITHAWMGGRRGDGVRAYV